MDHCVLATLGGGGRAWGTGAGTSSSELLSLLRGGRGSARGVNFFLDFREATYRCARSG